ETVRDELRGTIQLKECAMLRTITLCLSAMGIGSLAPAAEQSSGAETVQSFELENGLRVLLRPVHGAKQAAAVVRYSVGGDHDPQGRSGLAHLVEHVYVTAAAGDQPQRTVNEYLRRYPAGWNAQTGDRYTVFATVFPGRQLEDELKDAAVRMGDLRVEAG